MQTGGGDIFSRLTDPSKYTGAHKHRFDESGRGKGLAGRDYVSKGRGTANRATGYTGAYRGNTNTGTNETFHDLSQFLTRR